MFKPSEILICCGNNRNSPKLVIGKAYCVETVVSDWWVKLIHGRDIWGVKVYGDPEPYHHSLFRPLVMEDIAGFVFLASPIGRAIAPSSAPPRPD